MPWTIVAVCAILLIATLILCALGLHNLRHPRKQKPRHCAENDPMVWVTGSTGGGVLVVSKFGSDAYLCPGPTGPDDRLSFITVRCQWQSHVDGSN